MLEKWDFRDEEANSTLPQTNRRKSAGKLVLEGSVEDPPRAQFYDPKRKQTHSATLTECDCTDFQRQKTSAKPCMHIYRLAVELGLIDPVEKNTRVRVWNVDGEEARQETERLQLVCRSPAGWGTWNEEIHDSFVQKNRQYRAYGDVHERKLAERIPGGWSVNGWLATLERCGCPDFADRRLPCKHMYAVAILSELALPLGYDEYKTTAGRNEDMFFHSWGKATHPRQTPQTNAGVSEVDDEARGSGAGAGIRISLSFDTKPQTLPEV